VEAEEMNAADRTAARRLARKSRKHHNKKSQMIILRNLRFLSR
jgi:hypothetical protein